MTLAVLLVLAAVLALVFIVRLALAGNLRHPALASQLQPIDIDAFRNLTDSAQSHYLRQRLPAADFRHVQRHRLLATAAYIRVARQNAAQLVRIGQIALLSDHAPTAEAARQLIDNALLLQRNAAYALLRIYLAFPWPGAQLNTSSLLHRYERLNGSAMLLGRLQNPTRPIHLASRS